MGMKKCVIHLPSGTDESAPKQIRTDKPAPNQASTEKTVK